MTNINKAFLERTRKLWQPHIKRELTCEDSRQLVEGCVNYFNLLALWSHEVKQ
jgi:hypothetical protein